MNVVLKNSLIAPCGMNCGLCLAYQRSKNTCSGCITADSNKANHCSKCRIKNCEQLKLNNIKYCFDCKKYPCFRLKSLDKRYSTKYGMSMIENLNSIKQFGIQKFIKSEKEKWTCSKCGSMLCVHRNYCLKCKSQRFN